MKPTLPALTLVAAALALCACSSPTPDAPPAKAAAPTTAAAAAPTAPTTLVKAATVPIGDTIKGEVVETANGGGYIYVAVEVSPGQRVWAAGPPAQVKVGDTLAFPKGSEMKHFPSKTLGKTFETIYFIRSFGVAPAQPASKPASAAASAPSKAQPSKPISVSKAEGGHSILEAITQAATLSGKEVTVRGQVVKFNSGIMGANWLHLQDGTGDAAAKTHDLTVTTQDTAAVGDIVTITGTVATDKDFGGGYRYDVIVEGASVQAE